MIGRLDLLQFLKDTNSKHSGILIFSNLPDGFVKMQHFSKVFNADTKITSRELSNLLLLSRYSREFRIFLKGCESNGLFLEKNAVLC